MRCLMKSPRHPWSYCTRINVCGTYLHQWTDRNVMNLMRHQETWKFSSSCIRVNAEFCHNINFIQKWEAKNDSMEKYHRTSANTERNCWAAWSFCFRMQEDIYTRFYLGISFTSGIKLSSVPLTWLCLFWFYHHLFHSLNVTFRIGLFHHMLTMHLAGLFCKKKFAVLCSYECTEATGYSINGCFLSRWQRHIPRWKILDWSCS